MDKKLLPCPFCGADAKILNFSGAYRVTDTNYKCPVQFAEKWHATEREAIDAWNSRTPEIVYCRDCKYGVQNAFQCGLVLCQNEFFRRYRLFGNTDFCSFGERKA
ncbi:Lar family restriction alleviation protein [Oscillospiraceae bacterium WX1]